MIADSPLGTCPRGLIADHSAPGKGVHAAGTSDDSVGRSGHPAAREQRGRVSIFRVRNLVKRFGNFTALKDVSLEVREGEFVCFLGPSGCGKTTLLRAIAGLDPQNEGSIEIAGRDVSHLPPAARDFGIVFQSYALFPNLTVAANVGYGLVNQQNPARH